MRFVWLAISLCLLMTGCVTTPPLPAIASKPGDRVGIFVESGNSPAHVHIGTTVFNNFTKQYPYNWNLRAETNNAVKRSLVAAGFSPVDLAAEGLSYSDLAGLIIADSDTWKVAPGKEALLRKLSENLRLKAVVVVKESRVMAARECPGGHCSGRYADSSGLYTRSFFGLTHYYAVAALSWSVYSLDPPANTVLAEPLRSTLHIPATRLLRFANPVSFENITESEFAPVRDAVLGFVESTASDAARTLNAR